MNGVELVKKSAWAKLDQEEQERLTHLLMVIDSFSQVDAKHLIQRPALGALNFTRIEALVENTLSLLKEYRNFPLELLPDSLRWELYNQIQGLKTSLQKMDGFSINKIENDPEKPPSEPVTKVHDRILEEAKNQCQAFLKLALPYVGYLQLNSLAFQEMLNQPASLIQRANQQISEELERAKEKVTTIEAASGKAESVLQAMQGTAGKIGVARHSQDFTEMAKDHNRQSKWWLIASGLLISVIAASSMVFMFRFLPDAPSISPAIIQRIVSKIVFLSILYFGLTAALRNYRAHRHLNVLNKHRAAALQTFETFVKATDDDQTKNAVLLEATRCIFAPSVTGYLGNEEENPQNRIVEVLKLVGNTGGKN